MQVMGSCMMIVSEGCQQNTTRKMRGKKYFQP